MDDSIPANDPVETISTADENLPPQEDSTPHLKLWQRLPVLIALLVLAFGAGIGAGYWFWGREAAQPGDTNLADIIMDDDPSWGPKDAPVTIVEFSDYECPYCRKWHTEVWPKLQQAYPDQIRLIYRDFPLVSIHSNTVGASLAANCAAEQGKFWEFHDLVFNNNKPLQIETFQDYAGQIGIDVQKFAECSTSDRFLEEVEGDFNDGVTLGINGTPTFFIGSYRLIGAQPLEAFQQVIDSQLSEK